MNNVYTLDTPAVGKRVYSALFLVFTYKYLQWEPSERKTGRSNYRSRWFRIISFGFASLWQLKYHVQIALIDSTLVSWVHANSAPSGGRKQNHKKKKRTDGRRKSSVRVMCALNWAVAPWRGRTEEDLGRVKVEQVISRTQWLILGRNPVQHRRRTNTNTLPDTALNQRRAHAQSLWRPVNTLPRSTATLCHHFWSAHEQKRLGPLQRPSSVSDLHTLSFVKRSAQIDPSTRRKMENVIARVFEAQGAVRLPQTN